MLESSMRLVFLPLHGLRFRSLRGSVFSSKPRLLEYVYVLLLGMLLLLWDLCLRMYVLMYRILVLVCYQIGPLLSC